MCNCYFPYSYCFLPFPFLFLKHVNCTRESRLWLMVGHIFLHLLLVPQLYDCLHHHVMTVTHVISFLIKGHQSYIYIYTNFLHKLCKWQKLLNIFTNLFLRILCPSVLHDCTWHMCLIRWQEVWDWHDKIAAQMRLWPSQHWRWMKTCQHLLQLLNVAGYPFLCILFTNVN